MKKSRIAAQMLIWYAGIALTAVFGAEAPEAPAKARPNIIFLLADDMGWTDLGCYGSDLYQTPHIDRLASEGLRFTNAYAACTVCSPTRAAAMTGMYPARLHLTDWINGSNRPYAKLKNPDWTQWLKHDYVTIAEALKAEGYLTIHAGKWHLAPRSHVRPPEEDRNFFPIAHGFDIQFVGTCSPGTYFYPYRDRGFDLGLAEGGTPGEYLTDRLTREVLQTIEHNRERPFFLYFPYFNVHAPFEGKPEYVEKYRSLIRDGMRHRNPTYAAMVQSVDDSVGRIMAKLDQLDLAERTLIVFASDNGGWDHEGNPTDNAPLRGGKGTAYEGGVRVPTIVRWPGVIRPGVCREPISTVDFYPTFLEIAGAKGDLEHNAKLDGVSLKPLFDKSDATLGREAIFWHYPHYHSNGAAPYGAVRAGDWKLIELYEDMNVELYDLQRDIAESNDLAERMPDVADRLRRMLHAWRDRVGAQMPSPNPDYDARKDAESDFLFKGFRSF